MLLRPATPLSIILVIAFVLLLLSTLSTPIIKAIPLSTDEGWSFGVFGYCRTDGTSCISPHIGYSTDQLFPSGDNGDYSLNPGTRHSLFYILIVHPIAAFLTLVCAILALAAHFHGPSSSARYLLALLILTIPTLLASLLAFLVDILLFVPHMAWGGWIVLAATVLIVASSVLTCAMRRTLVSRKAQTKRIAENEDMNGTTYYNTLNSHRMMVDQAPRADSPPPLPSYADKSGQQYASFETKNHDSNPRQSEDRAPLNPVRDASVRSASNGPGGRLYGAGEDYPAVPGQGYDGAPPRRPSRDEYGNPISPVSSNEMGPPLLRHSGSRGSLTSNGSNRGMPYGRGRGYGPPQRGYGAPRGSYGPRGGYGPPQRGSYGPRGGYRGGPSPPGYNGRGGYGPPGRARDASPGYNLDPYYTRDTPSQLDHRPPPPVDDRFVARGASPGPGVGIGQAIEMDERTGSPPNMSYGQPGYSQDTIAERTYPASTIRQASPGRPDPGPMYSNSAYVPPRSDWKAPNDPSRFSPDHASSQYSAGRRQLSPVQASPTSDTRPGAHHARSGSEHYYEDVDPRFAVDEPSIDQHMHNSAVPNALMPGNAFAASRTQPQVLDKNYLQPPLARQLRSASQADNSNSNSSVDDPLTHDKDARSPDGSEASHFTSISQRPVNPHWRPGYSGGGQGSSAVAAQRRKEDIILNGNPDFALPGTSVGRRGRGGSGNNIVTAGLTPQGRYPSEI